MDEAEKRPEEQPQSQTESTPQPTPSPKFSPRRERQHYLFRAVIFTLLFLWFAYDGWYNTDPEMMKHRSFNRVGAFLLGIGLLHSLAMAVKYHFAIGRESGKSSQEATAR